LHPPYGSVGVERDLVPTSALDGQSLMADGRASVGSLFRLSGDGWGPDPHPAFGHPLPAGIGFYNNMLIYCYVAKRGK
jgi:hypothetical protein